MERNLLHHEILELNNSGASKDYLMDLSSQSKLPKIGDEKRYWKNILIQKSSEDYRLYESRLSLFNELLNRAEKPIPFVNANSSLLRKTYIKDAISRYRYNPHFESLLKQYDQKKINTPDADMATLIDSYSKEILKLLEKQFIINPNTSSLDLLPNDNGDKYRDFTWGFYDFPGNKANEPVGRNESFAEAMAENLKLIRPERRPNSNATNTAIILKPEFIKHKVKIEKLKAEIPSFEIVDVGGQKHKQGKKYLNKIALGAFLEMRDDASKDGIPLIVLAGFRPFSVKSNGNKKAKADYSTHHIGLAIDLKMSMTTIKNNNSVTREYDEIRTQSMQNVVNMRKSPIHKWMFIYGHKYGWYPYMNEPWHWEYNPVGFKEIFFKEIGL